MLATKVQNLAEKISPQLISWRRHLHRHPELSFEEWQTQAYLLDLLRSWGLSPRVIGQTGLVLELGGSGSGPFLALRADIDALPIQEINPQSYCSAHPGIMHACGHDAHTACLLGAIWVLNELRGEWSGRLRFIFQPGEEKLPGGASLLIAQGVLEGLGGIIGQHVEPNMPVGCIGVCDGPFMAAADELYLSLKGRGGHAARPHEAQDLVLLSAQLLVALQQLISRQTDPLKAAVLSFGKIYSVGGATNILPEELRIEGTLRTFEEPLRAHLHRQLEQVCTGIAAAFGARCELQIVKGYPPVYNHLGLNGQLRQAAQSYLGKDKVLELPPRMGSEDFGFYAQQIPAAFYRLGVQNPNGSGLHTPNFDIDEAALSWGAGLMAWLAMRLERN